MIEAQYVGREFLEKKKKNREKSKMQMRFSQLHNKEDRIATADTVIIPLQFGILQRIFNP